MIEQNPFNPKGQNENTALPTVLLQLIHTRKSILLSHLEWKTTQVYNSHRRNHSKHNILFPSLKF